MVNSYMQEIKSDYASAMYLHCDLNGQSCVWYIFNFLTVLHEDGSMNNKKWYPPPHTYIQAINISENISKTFSLWGETLKSIDNNTQGSRPPEMLDLKSSFMRKNTLFIHSALGLGSNTIVICAYNLIVLSRKKFLKLRRNPINQQYIII